MNTLGKTILFFCFMYMIYFVVDGLSLHEKTYENLYGRKPLPSSIIKTCSIKKDNVEIIASDCIRVNSSEWHIKPCGSSYWCKINIYSRKNIQFSKKKICQNESSVFFTKKLLEKFNYSKKIKNCL